MELSEDERARLLARYEIWGAERVRAELERPDRDLFARPGVTELAEEWLAHVADERGRAQTRRLLLLVAGAGLAAGLAFGLLA